MGKYHHHNSLHRSDMTIYRPFLETGHEMVIKVKEQREQAMRESDKKKKEI